MNKIYSLKWEIVWVILCEILRPNKKKAKELNLKKLRLKNCHKNYQRTYFLLDFFFCHSSGTKKYHKCTFFLLIHRKSLLPQFIFYIFHFGKLQKILLFVQRISIFNEFLKEKLRLLLFAATISLANGINIVEIIEGVALWWFVIRILRLWLQE